jgi:hypothetical protein
MNQNTPISNGPALRNIAVIDLALIAATKLANPGCPLSGRLREKPGNLI